MHFQGRLQVHKFTTPHSLLALLVHNVHNVHNIPTRRRRCTKHHLRRTSHSSLESTELHRTRKDEEVIIASSQWPRIQTTRTMPDALSLPEPFVGLLWALVAVTVLRRSVPDTNLLKWLFGAQHVPGHTSHTVKWKSRAT